MLITRRSRIRSGGWVRVSGCCLLVVGSCNVSPRERYGRRVTDTGKPALHAVHNERLQELMGELRRHVPEEWGTTLEREQEMSEIANVAAAMAKTAQYIPDVLKNVRLPEEEKRLFTNLADKLRDQSLELEQHAKKKRNGDIANSLENILATCNACHTAFRILPAATKR